MTDGDIGTWVGAVGTWLGALATGALVIAAVRGFRLTKEQIIDAQKQVSNLERSLQSNVSEQLMNGSFGVLRFLSENEHLYDCFYANQNPKDLQDKKLKVATEMVANYLEHILLQLNALPENSRNSWSSYIRDMLENSPIVCDHVRRYSKWYPSELVAIVDEVRPIYSPIPTS
jgi:hypothetical protein